jgi:hypothetical protein
MPRLLAIICLPYKQTSLVAAGTETHAHTLPRHFGRCRIGARATHDSVATSRPSSTAEGLKYSGSAASPHFHSGPSATQLALMCYSQTAGRPPRLQVRATHVLSADGCPTVALLLPYCCPTVCCTRINRYPTLIITSPTVGQLARGGAWGCLEISYCTTVPYP